MNLRRTTRTLVLAAALPLASAGCYRATVETGRPAGDQTVRQDWEPVWLWGLVSQANTDSTGQCPNGVSSVTTVHSFLNSVVGIVTAGIYTPMTVQAVCASSVASTAQQ